MANGIIVLLGLFVCGILIIFLGYYIFGLLTNATYTWSLSKNAIRLRVVASSIGLIVACICVALLFNILYKGINTVETVEETMETTVESTGIIETTKEFETEPEKPEELLVKDELEREIELLRRNDKDEVLRWFGASIDLKGITDSIPSDLIIDEVAEDGYARILVYNEQGVKEIEDNLRNRLRAENIGISDIELDNLVQNELSGYDKSNFYKIHTVKVERLNGLIIVTEHLKNVITNGAYMGRVVNYIEGEAFTNDTKESSFTEEILNRGVN